MALIPHRSFRLEDIDPLPLLWALMEMRKKQPAPTAVKEITKNVWVSETTLQHRPAFMPLATSVLACAAQMVEGRLKVANMWGNLAAAGARIGSHNHLNTGKRVNLVTCVFFLTEGGALCLSEEKDGAQVWIVPAAPKKLVIFDSGMFHAVPLHIGPEDRGTVVVDVCLDVQAGAGRWKGRRDHRADVAKSGVRGLPGRGRCTVDQVLALFKDVL